MYRHVARVEKLPPKKSVKPCVKFAKGVIQDKDLTRETLTHRNSDRHAPTFSPSCLDHSTRPFLPNHKMSQDVSFPADNDETNHE